MSRKTHLVGAWPGKCAPDAMETALQRLGPHLLRMSDGETDERSLWVTPGIEWMRVNPDVERTEQAREGLAMLGAWQLKEGHELRPENIRLGYYSAFKDSYAAFKYLREEYDQPQVKFQVGIPVPLEFAPIIFGFDVAAEHPEFEEAFRQATIREIEQIHAEAGDDVIFQLETVTGLVWVSGASDEESKKAVAQDVADRLNKLVADTPKGSRWGAHLCLGDFQHRAMGRMTDATPVVLVANAFAAGFPSDQVLEYIHVPFAAAAEPPSMEESWYRPLEALEIPEDVRFAAGFIHEHVPGEDHEKLLATIEKFAGREVDVAASCGLGRRPDPAEAWDAMDKAVALIEG